MTAISQNFTCPPDHSLIINVDRWGFPRVAIMATEGNGSIDIDWTLQKPNSKDLIPGTPGSGAPDPQNGPLGGTRCPPSSPSGHQTRR